MGAATLRIALAQINTTVGDLRGNADKIEAAIAQARDRGAAIVVCPELAITGYPPEDLLLRPQFIADNRKALEEVASKSVGILSIVGFVDTGHAAGVYEPSGRGGRAGEFAEGALPPRRPIYNAAALCGGGRIIDCYHKMFLPNYGVFDEKRYFEPGYECAVYRLPSAGRTVAPVSASAATDGGEGAAGNTAVTFGVNICEDIWYPEGPTVVQARRGGARLILNCNSSPYHAQKWRVRQAMLARRARETASYICYLNLVGGQDELVFDGHSLVFGPNGELVAQAPQFEESLLVVDLPVSGLTAASGGTEERRIVSQLPAGAEGVESTTKVRLETPIGPAEELPEEYIAAAVASARCRIVEQPPDAMAESVRGQLDAGAGTAVVVSGAVPAPLDETAEAYRALVTGLGDYVRKNGFAKVVIGLSGGIDSSLVATLAVDALGPDNVIGVNMPSRFSTQHGIEDARLTAKNLKIRFKNLAIHEVNAKMLAELRSEFEGTEPGVAEENLQARIRGNILMALSNKFGWLVLATGNKSEMACGYATLYGDMVGGFAVLKDVPKTLVYRLAEWRNRDGEAIPRRVIDKAPSAELREGQKDTDSLPEYSTLDPILQAYVEEDKSPAEIVAEGFDEATVERVLALVDRNEYKRRQAPPGIKITPRAFGKDRRMPITNMYRPFG